MCLSAFPSSVCYGILPETNFQILVFWAKNNPESCKFEFLLPEIPQPSTTLLSKTLRRLILSKTLRRLMLNYQNFRPSDDLYWLLNLACLKYTGVMLPDAYLENSNWTKDDEGKSKLIVKPQLLRPSFFNDLSLQIKRSMIVDDLKILFKGKDKFQNNISERELKEAYISDFKRSGKLRDLAPTWLAPDYQLPKINDINRHPRLHITFYPSMFLTDYDDFEDHQFAEYVFQILMKTDYNKEQILEVLETFRKFHDWNPYGEPPEWKKIVIGNHSYGWNTAICELIWVRGKSGMKCYGTRCRTNLTNVREKGWASFKKDETRPEFFYKRRDKPKVKKGSDYHEVSEWFFKQFYLIESNLHPFQYRYNARHESSPNYHELDASVRNAIRMGWDRVKNKSKIDIEDEMRIFAMPEYKIKPRSYESVVNSIAW